MGDAENNIEYTPEELQEIDRIIGSIVSSNAPAPGEEGPVSLKTEMPEETFMEDEPLEGFIGEPDDLDLPAGDLEDIVAEDREGPEGGYEEVAMEEHPEAEEIADLSEELELGQEFEDLDMGDFVEPGLEKEMPAGDEELELSQDELEDITDLVEVRDFDEEAPAEEIEFPEEIEEAFPEERGEQLLEEAPEEEPEETAEETPAPETGIEISPFEQLNRLTAGEPESLDTSEISDDEYIETAVKEQKAAEPDEETPDIDLEDIGTVEEGAVDEGQISPEMMLDKEMEADIPDLSDLSLEEAEAIPEASDEDIPEIDIGDLTEEGAGEAKEGEELEFEEPGLDDLSDEDMLDLGDIEDDTARETTIIKEESPDEDVPDIGISDEALDEIDKIEIGEVETSAEPAEEDPLRIEPLDDEMTEEKAGAPSYPVGEEAIELSDGELRRLKRAILLFNPSLIQVIKDAVVNDLLPQNDTRQLVDMIIAGKTEDNIHRFLEKKLGRSIDLQAETPQGRRVLYSRSEYTRVGRERQKRLVRATKIFAAAVLAAFVFTIVGYRFIYIPYKAKNLILEGTAVIRSKGDYQKKPQDYRKAENIFRDVINNYRDKYLFGYTSYGRAYFDMKEYSAGLKKLNEAYTIDPAHVDTLNALGHFYAHVPSRFYRAVRDNVNTWYYRGEKKEVVDRPQVDVAVEFYRRALLLDKDNITSLVGIGNAYYAQGQYLKAKKYYEDILKVDEDSVAGYSGLINLYIEQDSFAQVASLHAEARERDIMTGLPSPLLGKLAEYYLSKTRRGDSSVRIDFGVRSPRLIDDDDNTFPAVQAVLMELNKKDPDYPPLQVHSARFNRVKKNYKMMEKHLEKAISLSPNYFGALHLMGECHYRNNEPVKAYEYLTRALNSYDNQPEFTREPFYRETENIGKSYAVLGNVFYYFFDKVRYRFGDLEDEAVEDAEDVFINYAIARERYEGALKRGYESPEIHYNLGRIYYLEKLYRNALDQWLNLYEEFVSKPELMFSLGNAFYHLGNYEASKGEYLKLANVLEMEADGIRVAQSSNSEHIKIFQTLSAVYNNLGAVYQIQNNESKSGISYWKSIDFAKRLNSDNEYARVNLARSFNRQQKSAPILDESIPFSTEIYREEQRN